jgi:hypothetical protein
MTAKHTEVESDITKNQRAHRRHGELVSMRFLSGSLDIYVHDDTLFYYLRTKLDIELNVKSVVRIVP